MGTAIRREVLLVELLLGLLSLAGLSLFLSWWTRRSSALMPLVAVSIAMLWFMLAGCFGVLRQAGWLWYGICFAALAWVVIKEKSSISGYLTPGFMMFILGSVFFILLFFFTRPMLTQWDEFTFWGTAAKVTLQKSQLYTVAQSNLIARAYPPGLTVFNYMMQFFGPWAEYKLMASFAVVQLAALVVPSALWNKNRAGAVVFLVGMLALPLFFETRGTMSWVFLSCMSDAPMAAMFGGALCLFFAGGKKDHQLLLLFGVVLAALTSVKDMAFALALIALFVAGLDMLFCNLKNLRFFRLRRWAALLVGCAVVALFVLASYGVWAWHLDSLPERINRFDLGNQEGSLQQGEMLVNGITALLGLRKDDHFSKTFGRMSSALFESGRPVSLVGPGVVVFVIILLVLGTAWLFSTTKRARKRILVFGLGMLFCFMAFYIFNVFTYSFILKGHESETLKDYHRYIYPYWFGWLMGSLLLLAGAAAEERALRLRVQLARFASLGWSLLLVAVVGLWGNRQANFLLVSPSLYGQRLSVQQSVNQSLEQGMQPDDVIYLISQGDDATRFYMFGYEMQAKLDFLYVGKAEVEQQAGGSEKKQTVYLGNAAASLVAPDDTSGNYEFAVPCTPSDLKGYLKQQQITHLLLDVPDEYILEEFGPMFSDGLEGWSIHPDTGIEVGRRYYRVVWNGDQCGFVPAGEWREGTA